MAVLTVTINAIILGTPETLVANFNWSALEGVNGASDSGEEEYPITDSGPVINQKVIDSCVARANAAGINVLPTDRKILVAGLAN